MHSHHPAVSDNTSNIFNEIVRLAQAKDETGLAELVTSGVNLGAHQGAVNPVKWLAMQGDTASVDFLITKFKASRNHAVEGYARGGHLNQVLEQLEAGASYDVAVLGFAAGNHEGLVKDFLEDGGAHDLLVRGFAIGGHVEKVDAILQTQPQLISEAINGFALSGNVEEVDALVFDQDERKYAIWGYAVGGYQAQVDALLIAGVDPDMALWGYAEGGHVELVNQMLADGMEKNLAVYAYACGGHINEVNTLVTEGQGLDVAVDGYYIGLHLTEGNLLRLMTLTDSSNLRLLIADKAEELYPSLNVSKLFCDANVLHSIMADYSLDIEQAQSLRTKGARAWLLQGQQLVEANTFPNEIFFHIASFVVGLPRYDTEVIYRAVYKHLFPDSGGRTLTNCDQRLFAPASPISDRDEQQQVEACSHQRQTF